MRNRRKLSPLAGAMIEGLEPRFMLAASAVPGVPDLRDAFDTGTYSYDNLTKLDNSTADAHLEFQMSSTKSGATINLYCDNVLIGTAAGLSPSTIVATNGSQDLPDGPHVFTARQIELGMDESPDSAGLTVTIDTLAPNHMIGLDPSFGTYGITNVLEGWMNTFTAFQPDGKTLIAQPITSGGVSCFSVTRLDASGSLDGTFGTGGTVVTQVGTGNSTIYGVAVGPDGKILALGQADWNGIIAVVRYDSQGNLDPTFGTGGIAITNIGLGGAAPSAAAVQPNGKIVVAGCTGSNFFAVRYDDSGNPDLAFGNAGVAVTPVSAYSTGYDQVFILSGDRILVTGGSPAFFMVCFDSSGNLDTSFGTGGRAHFGNDLWLYKYPVSLQADGKIVVSGFSTQYGGYGICRFDSNGQIDTQFMTNVDNSFRALPFPFNNPSFAGSTAAVQPDGKILMLAINSANSPLGYSQSFIRFNSDGTFDSAFGYNGRTVNDPIGTMYPSPSMTILPDGKILVAGDAFQSGTSQDYLIVARLVESSSPSIILRSDTGLSPYDHITNATTLDFSVNTSAGLQMYRDGVSITPVQHSFSGVVSYTLTNQLTGTHSYTLKAIDAAGNETPLSDPFVLTIITDKPATPPAPTLIPGSDSGDPTDNLTNVNTPVISISASPYYRFGWDNSSDGSNIYRQGATYTWSKLADGTHTIRVRAVDVAGNVSDSSPPLVVTIDTVPPVVAVDNLATGDTSPALTGTVSDATSGASSGHVTVNGQVYAISVSGQTAWSLPAGTIVPALAPAIYTVTAAVTDVAGNTSTASGQLLVAWPGDANCDGVVAFADYQMLEAHFGLAGQNWSGGDFDADGAVSFADYQILEAHFGRFLDLPVPAENQTLSFSADSLALITGSSPAGIPPAAVSRQRAASGAAALALSARLGDSTACPIRPMEFKFAESTCVNSLPGNGTRIPRKDRPVKAAPARGLELGIQPDDLLAIAL